MSKNWYALRIKPHKEISVYERLDEENIEQYLPLVRVQPTNPRSAKLKPYFPGYMFVCVDLAETGVNKFRWLYGVIGLVEFGGIPAVVPDNLVNDLRQLMGQIEDEGGLAKFEFQQGDTVVIEEGPFEGYEAMFDLHLPGKDRAQVLLAFLSQVPQPIQLDTASIKKIEK